MPGAEVGDDWFEIDQDFLRFADGLRPWQSGDEDPVAVERFPDDEPPTSRPLRIYTQDPSASAMDGHVATIKLRFEPLAPGPSGRIVEVFDLDDSADQLRRPLDLESRSALLSGGRTPSLGDSAFHQQMTFAVVMRTWETFRSALGRDPVWGFTPPADGRLRLRIRPHASNEENAYYDRDRGELQFGYYDARQPVTGRNRMGGRVYTCLSHDIIVHETTHALLDGMRRSFTVPSNPEVLAFHEAFADLVAVFMHFDYPAMVEQAFRRSQPDQPVRDVLLTAVARQFGHTTGRDGPLRSACANLAAADPAAVFDPGLPPHELSKVLLQAVFDAFNIVFERKTKALCDLAQRYRPSAGAIDPTLAQLLADKARSLARQFLNIVIRAIDYCPPVDITFGDYLRAMITADADLVPDDPYGYRDALIEAFAKRCIAPLDVPNLAEDVLLWSAPDDPLTIPELHFEQLRLGGDPRQAPAADELERQAAALGRFATRPEHAPGFRLALPGDPALAGDRVGPPRIASIRPLRRVSEDLCVRFGLIAEIVQERFIAEPGRGPDRLLGGSTVILNAEGKVEYLIHKRLTKATRIAEQSAYATGQGAAFWQRRDGGLRPARNALRGLHAMAEAGPSRAPRR